MITTKFKKNMNKEELERYTILTEEASEIIKEVSKAIRFGPDSENPVSGETPRQNLNQEVADLLVAVDLMLGYKDLDLDEIMKGKDRKLNKLKKFLIHNKISDEKL